MYQKWQNPGKLNNYQFWILRLSGNDLRPVVQKVDCAFHRVNFHQVDNAIGFPYTYRWKNIYPVDRTIRRLDNRFSLNSVN